MGQRDQPELNVDFGHTFETEALEAVIVFDISKDGFRLDGTHTPVI